MQLTPCGHSCDQCPSFLGPSDKACEGCNTNGGKPWWGECRVYACVLDKKVTHCGYCTEFPCNLQIGHYDPDNPNGQKNAVLRTGILAYRTKHGDDETIALLKRIRGE